MDLVGLSRDVIQAWGRRVGLMKLTKGASRYRNCGEEDGARAIRQLWINYRMNMCLGSGELCGVGSQVGSIDEANRISRITRRG